MSNFNNSNLPVRPRSSMESNDSHDGETESNSAAPATSTTRTRTTQADIKAAPVHYLCPSCDQANRIATNLSIHWKRKHQGPWVVGDVRVVVRDGQTFRYKDRKQYNLHPATVARTQNDPDMIYEAVYLRTVASSPNGTSATNINRKVAKVLEGSLSDQQLDAEIVVRQEALARLEPNPRANQTRVAATQARGKAQLLAHKLHDFVSRGRNIFARKDGTYTYKYNDPRERSPKRPRTADPHNYRDRSPVLGGILRRPMTPSLTAKDRQPLLGSSRIPPIPLRISSMLSRRERNKSTSSNNSKRSVTFPSKYGGVKKTDESESSEEGKESSVSEEE